MEKSIFVLIRLTITCNLHPDKWTTCQLTQHRFLKQTRLRFPVPFLNVRSTARALLDTLEKTTMTLLSLLEFVFFFTTASLCFMSANANNKHVLIWNKWITCAVNESPLQDLLHKNFTSSTLVSPISCRYYDRKWPPGKYISLKKKKISVSALLLITEKNRVFGIAQLLAWSSLHPSQGG